MLRKAKGSAIQQWEFAETVRPQQKLMAGVTNLVQRSTIGSLHQRPSAQPFTKHKFHFVFQRHVRVRFGWGSNDLGPQILRLGKNADQIEVRVSMVRHRSPEA